MSRIRHTLPDIAKKVRQAAEMEARGLRQRQIGDALGVSVMTLHRWRKKTSTSPSPRADAVAADVLAQLLAENLRLRHTAVQLALAIAVLKEALS